MCGKFTQMSSWREVHEFSQPLTISAPNDQSVITTPMRTARILLLNADGDRELVDMRWGFAGKEDMTLTRPRHMHARAETVDKLPTFRDAFAAGRGILMVETFNEGQDLPGGKTKQWTITPKDGQPIAIAVICEEWRRAAESLWTFVMITVPPNSLIVRVTDRMPAVLPRAVWPVWLGETDASDMDVKGRAANLRRCWHLDHDRTAVRQIAPLGTRRSAGSLLRSKYWID